MDRPLAELLTLQLPHRPRPGYSCHPWAQACYSVSESSLQSSSKLPLPPFVALSNFRIGQHPSLSANPFSTDSAIRLLYSSARCVFQEQITEGGNQIEDILQVCEETENTRTKAISALLEGIPDVTMWSRTKNILENGKLIPQSNKRKYEEILHSDNSIDNNTGTATTDNSTNTDTANIDSHSNTNTNTINNLMVGYIVVMVYTITVRGTTTVQVK